MSDGGMSEYKRVRRRFCRRTYWIFVGMLTASIVQWGILIHFGHAAKAFHGREIVPVVMFAFAASLTFVYIFIEALRRFKFLNIMISLVIMEAMVIAVVGISIFLQSMHFFVAFTIATLMLAIFMSLGSIIIHDLTADVVVLFVIFFGLFVVSIFFSLAAAILNSRIPYAVYCLIIAGIIITFAMYHAQAVQGGRFAEMRSNDYCLGALIFYCQFIALLLILMYCDSRMYGKYADNQPPPLG